MGATPLRKGTWDCWRFSGGSGTRAGLRPAAKRSEGIVMAKFDAPRLAILGAGPIGVEAALYARSLNLPVTLYERGRIGEHLRRWGHVRLFSPFGMNVTPLGRSALLAADP